MSDMFEMVARMAGKSARVAEKCAQVETDREHYAATIQYFRETGNWSEADIVDYAKEVKRIMKSGTADEKMAASEFWTEKASIVARNDRKAA